MATKKKNEEPMPEQNIENALGQGQQFIQDNAKPLVISLAAIVLIVVCAFGYRHFISEPRQEKAAEAIFAAEQSFNNGDFETALNGDGTNLGFLDVISSFGSTRQGNIAKHYAGICYYKTGDYEKAIATLKGYKATKGAPNSIINAQNLGMIADALVQSGKQKEAVPYYEKAIAASDNVLVTPYYLKKLGMLQETLGNSKAALELYEKISTSYPTSMEASDILKYIGAVEAAQ